MSETELRYDGERMARRVKSLRVDKGWDQQQLADVAKVSKDTVNSVENNRRGVTLNTIVALADALGCESVENLIFRTTSAA